MRQDLMQAARRTETLQLFKQYVRELRARKQAERDAEKRARGDTTGAKADTAKVVPSEGTLGRGCALRGRTSRRARALSPGYFPQLRSPISSAPRPSPPRTTARS